MFSDCRVATNKRIREEEKDRESCFFVLAGCRSVSQINQVTVHALFPQIQYLDKVIAAVHVVVQQQVPQIQMVSKTESPEEEIDETIKFFPVERIPERNGDHIVDVPVPQTSEEVAEVVKAVKETPLKHITEEMYEQIDVASHSMAQKVVEAKNEEMERRRLDGARKKYCSRIPHQGLFSSEN